MQKVLIIGGTGFIGQHTVRLLASTGYTILATCREGRIGPSVPGVSWVPTNLAQPGAAAAWPASCDAILFLAQSRCWRDFPRSADEVFAVNVAGLYQSVAYALRAGARCFIYSSTGSVYPQTARHLVRETEAIALDAPRRFYDNSKLAAELLLQSFQQLLRVVVLRLFTPYGLGQSPDMLLPQLVRKVREGQPIQLEGRGGLVINPVAVADVAEALCRCLQLDRSATFNVAGPETLTLQDIGRTIGEVLGCKPHFECHPDREAPVLAGDTAALKAGLGWTPATRLQDGLRHWLNGQTQPLCRSA